jgi:hypothetical protein
MKQNYKTKPSGRVVLNHRTCVSTYNLFFQSTFELIPLIVLFSSYVRKDIRFFLILEVQAKDHVSLTRHTYQLD